MNTELQKPVPKSFHPAQVPTRFAALVSRVLGLMSLWLFLCPQIGHTQNTYEIGLRNIRITPTSVFSPEEEVQISYSLVSLADTVQEINRTRVDVNLAVRDSMNDTLNNALLLETHTVSNRRVEPRQVIDEARIVRQASALALAPGGNIVVVWPTGTSIEPADTFEIIITFEDTTVSLESREDVPEMRVYPIPARQDLQYDSGISLQSVQAISLDGKILPLSFDQGIIRTRSLPAGVYTLILQNALGRKRQIRILKQ